jgi:hypothetical protein
MVIVLKLEEEKSEGVKPEEVRCEEIPSEGVKSEGAEPEGVKLEAVKSENVKSEEAKPEEVKSEEVKSEDKVNETIGYEQDDFFTRPTQPIIAVKPVMLKKETPSLLRVDKQGRPFVRSRNTVANTADLVETLVEHFMAINGTIPSAIYLSAFRYLTYGMIMHYYYPRLLGLPRIPYAYEPDATYEVLVRGEVFDGN